MDETTEPKESEEAPPVEAPPVEAPAEEPTVEAAPAEEGMPTEEAAPTEETAPADAIEEPVAPQADVSCASAPERPSGGGIAGWPFVVYLAAWAALAAATGVLLTAPDAAAVPVQDVRYPFLLLGGIVLAACGPLLALTTWIVAFARAEKGCRGGLLTLALVRGASATLFGVLVWWGALLLVDALRLGLI